MGKIEFLDICVGAFMFETDKDCMQFVRDEVFPSLFVLDKLYHDETCGRFARRAVEALIEYFERKCAKVRNMIKILEATLQNLERMQ